MKATISLVLSSTVVNLDWTHKTSVYEQEMSQSQITDQQWHHEEREQE